MLSRSQFNTLQRRKAGFVTIYVLPLICAIAVYAAVTLPLAQRLSSQWPSAIWLPLIPLALVYLGGFVAALISPYDSPRFKESFLHRGLYFGNLAFINVAFWSIPILLLYLAVRLLRHIL